MNPNTHLARRLQGKLDEVFRHCCLTGTRLSGTKPPEAGPDQQQRQRPEDRGLIDLERPEAAGGLVTIATWKSFESSASHALKEPGAGIPGRTTPEQCCCRNPRTLRVVEPKPIHQRLYEGAIPVAVQASPQAQVIPDPDWSAARQSCDHSQPRRSEHIAEQRFDALVVHAGTTSLREPTLEPASQLRVSRDGLVAERVRDKRADPGTPCHEALVLELAVGLEDSVGIDRKTANDALHGRQLIPSLQFYNALRTPMANPMPPTGVRFAGKPKREQDPTKT